MRKVVSALTVATAVVLLAAPAWAQPYPPVTTGLTVSESVVVAGDSLVVSGEGGTPGGTVNITMARASGSALGGAANAVAASPVLARALAAVKVRAQGGGTSLGTATPGTDGSFEESVTIPADTTPGRYTITGTDSVRGVLGEAVIRVIAPTGTTDEGLTVDDLPFTGGQVLPGLVVGAGLILAGGLLLVSIRRRRQAA
jgi:LPXTG cell wall anchor motif